MWYIWKLESLLYTCQNTRLLLNKVCYFYTDYILQYFIHMNTCEYKGSLLLLGVVSYVLAVVSHCCFTMYYYSWTLKSPRLSKVSGNQPIRCGFLHHISIISRWQVCARFTQAMIEQLLLLSTQTAFCTSAKWVAKLTLSYASILMCEKWYWDR